MKETLTVWNPFSLLSCVIDFLLSGIRRRNLQRVERWKRSVVTAFVRDVFSSEAPFYYDTGFSFVQSGEFDTDSVIRFHLFYPDYPIAIDVFGPESRSDYRKSFWYLSRSDWEKMQKTVALKRNRLLEYKCPYLVVWDYEPTNIPSLSESVRNILGFYPK
jgi:hypothetical protein